MTMTVSNYSPCHLNFDSPNLSTTFPTSHLLIIFSSIFLSRYTYVHIVFACRRFSAMYFTPHLLISSILVSDQLTFVFSFYPDIRIVPVTSCNCNNLSIIPHWSSSYLEFQVKFVSLCFIQDMVEPTIRGQRYNILCYYVSLRYRPAIRVNVATMSLAPRSKS